MNRLSLWSWCAVPALLLAACGGGAPSGPSGEITESQASAFRSAGGEVIITLADPDTDGIGGQFAGSTARRAASLFEAGLRTAGVKRGDHRTSCTVTKGSETDTDKDGVRDDSTDTYTCDFGTEATFTLDGNTKIKDDSVDAKAGMFPFGGATVTPTFDLTFASDNVSGSVNTAGLWNFILTGTTASGSVSITQTINVSAAGQSASGKVGWYITPWSVTPTDIENPKDKGSVSWKSYYQYEMGQTSYVLEGTTTDLVYDKACGVTRENQAKYNGGSIQWVDGAGNEVKVVFATDCTPTWTFNGGAL